MSDKKIEKFTDLDAWQLSHELVLMIYEVTNNFPTEEKFGLTSQLRRAVISITSNIAEGFSRFYFGDKLRFYYNARGSLSEVESQLITAKDVGLLDEERFGELMERVQRVEIVINGLIRSTKGLKDKHF